MALHPNIVQTQNRMRGIPDAQLQQMLIQLTQTGKVGTPEYLMAAGEMQARKDLRAKANVPQANPQPVIADLLTAGAMPPAAMPQTPAPEDAGGIAAMEAPNMETIDMMGGGLVAFEGGGEVPRYQNQGVVKYDPADPINRFFGNPDPKKRYEMTQAEKDEARRLKEMGLLDMFNEFIVDPTKRAFAYNGRQDLAPPVKGEGVAGGDVEVQPGGFYGGAAPAGIAAVGNAAGVTPPAADAQPTVKLKSDETAGLPAINAPTYGDALALGRQFAGSTADIEKQLKELPSEEKSAQDQFELYKKMGVDLDPYKSLKESLQKEKSEEGEAKTKAGLARLAEFGFAWASENGPTLQAAAKAGKQVMPGLTSDIKELDKLSRERNRTLADISAIDSKMRKDVTDAGLAKLQKRRDNLEKRRDEINDNAARIAGTIYGQQLSSQTQMATTGMTTRATIAKLEQQLGTDRAAKIVGIAEKLLAQNKLYPAMSAAEQNEAFNQAVRQAMAGMATAETTVTPR